MQVLFVVIDISYAAFQVVLVERFIAQDSIVIVIGLGKYSNNLIVITAFLALYSLTFIVIDFNFLYRFWAVKAPYRLSLFTKKWFIVMVVMAVIVEYFFWFHVAYTYFSATDHGRLKIRNVTFEKFGIDTLTQEMIMGDFFNEDGSRNWHPAVAVITFCNVLAFCFGFMIYASVTIINFLRNAKLVSNAALSMQRQLFVTLSAQTLIPFVLLYSPCGINIVFPFFGWDAELVADLSPLSLSLFLPLDAIAVLYLMNDYRKTVLHYLSCG
ncbi:hypothetical protein PRIPAC_76944, partial [Pristionchus pacificus]|uniref:G protein-coupled receptor n=1 Tax=Pristionchus pacificus TaxID=54126 RepID=A0A2A6C448_PRIPA